MNHIYLANALVTAPDGKMLAVRKRHSIYFQMVGGKIDEKEEPIDTLFREFREEINIDLVHHHVIFLGKHETMAVNEENTRVHANVFHVQLNSLETIKIASEIEEMVWISKENYTNYHLAHLLKEFSLPIWLNMDF